MTTAKTSLPLTIPLDVPTSWTPEQAFAVVDLLDSLRDLIWNHYNVQLLDQYRTHYQPDPGDRADPSSDDRPF
jgi:hypothetical protein